MTPFITMLLKAGLDALAGLITDILAKNPGISEADLVAKIKAAQADGNAGKWLDEMLVKYDAEFKKP